jgi:hypothetical protein
MQCRMSLWVMRLAVGALLTFNAAMTTGCAGSLRSGDAADRTGGLTLELYIERDDDSREFYRVLTDGTIGFGGATDARMRQATWTGTMTDDEVSTLLSLIEQHTWRQQEPASGSNPDEIDFRIDLRTPQGRRQYHVKGRSEAVLPVYHHLRQISLRRFDHIMDRLPQPSREAEFR